jgi:hypothetical protein
LTLRDRQRERQKKAVWLIKGKDLPWEHNKQGVMRWYMHPLLESPCINTMQIFVQEIPPGGRSGRLHHPGNQVSLGEARHCSASLAHQGSDRAALQLRSG